MSNFNKVILIGRLTRDPEMKTFANGGKVARIGFVTNNRKKDNQTGQWADDPCFLDIDAFNRGQGTLANVVEQYCRKGSTICIEGRLVQENWDDKSTGQKRSKIKVIADTIQLLDKKGDAVGGGSAPPSRQSGPASYDAPPPADDDGNQIPF